MTHEITQEMVRDAPTFEAVWPQIERRCSAGLLVAHNTAFDVRILTSCATAYGLPSLTGQYMCTVRLARALLPRLLDHKLGTLTSHFGIPHDPHHALSDAVACAELAIRLVGLAGPVGIDPYCRDLSSFGSASARGAAFSGACVRISLDDLAVNAGAARHDVTPVEPASSDGRFDGMRFVFTGNLASLKRSEAEEIVKRQGGKVTGAVSKKTNHVVVGDKLMDDEENGRKLKVKHAKARELEKALDLELVVRESEFLSMIK